MGDSLNLLYPPNVLILKNKNKNNLIIYGKLGWIILNIPFRIKMSFHGHSFSLITISRGEPMLSTFKALLFNSFSDISFGYYITLQLRGVGYKFIVEQNILYILLGFSHRVCYILPLGVNVVIIGAKGIFLKVFGFDRQSVCSVGAAINRIKVPDPYKGKGIAYKGRPLAIKSGKKAYQ